MSAATSTSTSGQRRQADVPKSGIRIVARRSPSPLLSDRQVVRLAGVSVVVILLCAGFALLAWMSFWLTAENQWALNTGFLWASGAVVLTGLGWLVALAIRWAVARR